MSDRRHGRAVPLAGAAGLIFCLACAARAADPALVRPDEAAGLPPVAETTFREADAIEPWEDRAGDREAGFCGDEGGPGEAGFGAIDFAPTPPVRGEAFGSGPAGGDREPAASSPGVPSWGDPREPFDFGGRVAGGPSSWEVAGPQAVDEASLFAATEPPPVVRLRSPDVELLPLATEEEAVEKTSLLSWASGTKGRIRGDYLTDFDETDRIGAQALSQGWLGLGFDAEANYWQRPVAGLGREPLWTGDLNLIYNLMPHPRFKFRSGAGAAWRVDDGDPHAGWNVTHGLDVYLLWRAMATGELDWGRFDDDKLLRYRLALGLTYDSFEFFTGYESYKLGGERLDGWVNGVSWWY